MCLLHVASYLFCFVGYTPLANQKPRPAKQRCQAKVCLRNGVCGWRCEGCELTGVVLRLFLVLLLLFGTHALRTLPNGNSDLCGCGGLDPVELQPPCPQPHPPCLAIAASSLLWHGQSQNKLVRTDLLNKASEFRTQKVLGT